jgi:methionyl-tRNA synthetase
MYVFLLFLFFTNYYAFALFQISSALEHIMDAVGEVNRYFANREPWNLRPGKPNEDESRLRTVLSVTLESLRVFGILLQPAMPSSMERLLDYLGVENEGQHRALTAAYIDLERVQRRPVGAALGFDDKLVLFEKKR